MLYFSLLGSGSSGNSSLIFTKDSQILIDAGFSLKQLAARLELVGQNVDKVKAVFITHEHSDHILGLGVLARRAGIPVYITQETFEALPDRVGKLPEVHFFEAGDTIQVGNLRVTSFSVSHDAADPVGFTVESGGAKLGFASDLGHPSQLVRARLNGCHALALEANYCPVMLRNGSYPPEVQQRIRGRTGHLSNQDMSSLLSALLHEGLRTIVLYHISENNNTPEQVRMMAAGVVRGHHAQVYLAEQDRPTPIFEVRP